MVWHITKDVEEFLDAAGGFLRARPVENTVLLTVAENKRLRGLDPHSAEARGVDGYGAEAAVFGWREGGDAAFLRTPPRAALISAMPPEAAAELAGVLADRGLPGVDGPDAAVAAFAAEWHRLTGASGQVRRRHRLYRLDSLAPPTPPARGSARRATARDRDLLIDWMTTFSRDIGEDAIEAEDFVDDKLAHSGVLLWEVDGRPVSMASETRAQAGMVRIQAVYTPAEHRSHGYAGAVTTALSRAALDAGAAHVVLFTDLANPTSNALYQRLGYVPLEDRSMVEFNA